jgi:hypothetical protein
MIKKISSFLLSIIFLFSCSGNSKKTINFYASDSGKIIDNIEYTYTGTHSFSSGYFNNYLGFSVLLTNRGISPFKLIANESYLYCVESKKTYYNYNDDDETHNSYLNPDEGESISYSFTSNLTELSGTYEIHYKNIVFHFEKFVLDL